MKKRMLFHLGKRELLWWWGNVIGAMLAYDRQDRPKALLTLKHVRLDIQKRVNCGRCAEKENLMNNIMCCLWISLLRKKIVNPQADFHDVFEYVVYFIVRIIAFVNRQRAIAHSPIHVEVVINVNANIDQNREHEITKKPVPHRFL